jgi:hypothetical protein
MLSPSTLIVDGQYTPPTTPILGFFFRGAAVGQVGLRSQECALIILSISVDSTEKLEPTLPLNNKEC